MTGVFPAVDCRSGELWSGTLPVQRRCVDSGHGRGGYSGVKIADPLPFPLPGAPLHLCFVFPEPVSQLPE